MFVFQLVIAQMQDKIVLHRANGADETVLKESVERVDKLIEIYKNFDAFYYSSHFAQQKILQLQSDKFQMAAKINELESEIEKLTKSLKWK